MAYRKHYSTLDNAKIHVASRYLLRMDLTDFFPSISHADLMQYIVQRRHLFPGWTPLDMTVFCGLVCRGLVLTVGAPTSPGLSNVVCYDMDVVLHALSERHAVKYSRYADDLFFSTDQPNVLREIEKEVVTAIPKLEVPKNLKVNVGKTRHSSKRGARRVTGIVLGSDGFPYVGRGLKRKIRSLIYRFESLDESTRASLAGMITYATGLDPDFMNSLIKKYGLPAVHKAVTARAKGKPTMI